MDNSPRIPGFTDTQIDYLSIIPQEYLSIPHGLKLSLSGEITAQNSYQVLRKIELCIFAGYTRLLFVCNHLDYLSSTGVGIFVDVLKSLRVRNGRLCLFEIQPRVYEVLQLLGFVTFLHCDNDLDSAEAYLKGSDLASISLFPKVIKCPYCTKSLKVTKEGRFRCPACKGILKVNSIGTASI